MNAIRSRLCIVAAAILATIGLAYAHSGATGIVKERMDVMKSVAADFKAIAEIMQGKRSFDRRVVERSALSIADHAAVIPDLFPKGSNPHPSEALPAVWENWPQFKDVAGDMRTGSLALAARAKSASGPADIDQDFQSVAKTCKSCHESFRAP